MNRQSKNVAAIFDLVRSALEELNDLESWTREHKEMMSPDSFTQEFKIIRIQLPRRSGTSTAALDLYDMYPKSFLVYNTQRELRYQIDQQRRYYLDNDNDIFVLPDRQADSRWDRLAYLPRGRPTFDLMIFDGVSRMQERCVDIAIGSFDPFVKLFVLLG